MPTEPSAIQEPPTVAANNYAMGDTATLPNFSFEVQGLLSLSGTNGLDANPAAIISDFLTNPRYGAGFPAAMSGILPPIRTYCQALGIVLSPLLDTQQEAQRHLSDIVKITNSAIVWSGGLLKIIPYGDQPVTGNGVTYTPDIVPVYSLGEDDFIVQESSVGTSSGVAPGGPALRSAAGPMTGGFSDDPVRITRSTPADATNSIQLECLDRSNSYNTAIVEAFDQAAIELYGISPRRFAEGAGYRRPHQCRADCRPAHAAARFCCFAILTPSSSAGGIACSSRWTSSRSPMPGSASRR